MSLTDCIINWYTDLTKRYDAYSDWDRNVLVLVNTPNCYIKCHVKKSLFFTLWKSELQDMIHLMHKFVSTPLYLELNSVVNTSSTLYSCIQRIYHIINIVNTCETGIATQMQSILTEWVNTKITFLIEIYMYEHEVDTLFNANMLASCCMVVKGLNDLNNIRTDLDIVMNDMLRFKISQCTYCLKDITQTNDMSHHIIIRKHFKMSSDLHKELCIDCGLQYDTVSCIRAIEDPPECMICMDTHKYKVAVQITCCNDKVICIKCLRQIKAHRCPFCRQDIRYDYLYDPLNPFTPLRNYSNK
jgi:hypothetical protein